MALKHYHIIVHGRVQGVFFRKHTSQMANGLGLKGFVMNRPDGSVYIEVEGEEDRLETLMNWCHQGSPGSKVEEINVTVDPLILGFQGFEIRH